MSLLIERFAMHGDALEPAAPEPEIVQCVKSMRRKLGLRAVAPSGNRAEHRQLVATFVEESLLLTHKWTRDLAGNH